MCCITCGIKILSNLIQTWLNMKITEVPVFFMHYCSSPSTESVSEYCIDLIQSQGEESYGSYYCMWKCFNLMVRWWWWCKATTEDPHNSISTLPLCINVLQEELWRTHLWLTKCFIPLTIAILFLRRRMTGTHYRDCHFHNSTVPDVD